MCPTRDERPPMVSMVRWRNGFAKQEGQKWQKNRETNVLEFLCIFFVFVFLETLLAFLLEIFRFKPHSRFKRVLTKSFFSKVQLSFTAQKSNFHLKTSLHAGLGMNCPNFNTWDFTSFIKFGGGKFIYH